MQDTQVLPASQASIAVDLGAESCRVSLLRWIANKPRITLVHRFPNGPVREKDGSLRWPLQQIVDGVEEGIQRCAIAAPEGIRSIGVDGWAVDYVRLNDAGEVIEDPFCYRDERNLHAATQLHRHISPEQMRDITGIELQPLNTLYQLYADKLSGKLPRRWLNLPEYMLYRWGAEPVAEQTNASHTQLLDLRTRSWSQTIFQASDLDLSCAPRIVLPGTPLGHLYGPLAKLPALRNTKLIAPACHDTASAVAGIAQCDNDWIYISCGTWSLVGTLLETPLNSTGAKRDNFTNLCAVGGMTCFHKGINGMWILKQCMEQWAVDGEAWEISQLLQAASLERTPTDLLHIDDPELMSMGDMPSRINKQLAARGRPCLSEHRDHAPAMVCLLLHSLAYRYAEVIERIRVHTGKHLRRIVMVGGGAQNEMLRQLTVERTGLEILVGPSESSTIGNLSVQLAVLYGRESANSINFGRIVNIWAARLETRAAAS